MTSHTSALVFPAEDFLLQITRASEVPLDVWIGQHRQLVLEYIRRYGGILFHGFDLTPEQFRVVGNLIAPGPAAAYTGGMSPRPKYSDELFVSTQRPRELEIPLHHEYSYFSFWPMKIFFYCKTPAPEGGFTTLASTRTLMKVLNPRIIEKLHQRQVRYVRNYFESFDSGWQRSFATAERATVEKFCAASGVTCSWLPDGGLRTQNVAQGAALHPETGELLFHNHVNIFSMYHDGAGRLSPILLQYVKTVRPEVVEQVLRLRPQEMPTNAFYGDGSPIEPALVEEIHETLAQIKRGFAWSQGDFMVLDNMLAFHGRSAFTGDRLVLTMLKEMHHGRAVFHRQEPD